MNFVERTTHYFIAQLLSLYEINLYQLGGGGGGDVY